MTEQSPPPRLDLFMVAEHIRQEPGGKITIIGAYTFGNIKLRSGTALPGTTTLAFFMGFKEGSGNFNATITITDPAGKQMSVVNLGKVTKRPEGGLNLIVNSPNFQIASLGRYSVEIKLDGKTYQDSFTISSAP